MYSDWNISAGLNSSIEVYQISTKQFSKRISDFNNISIDDEIKREENMIFKKRLEDIKKEKGKEKLNLSEVWGLLESRNK